MIKMVRKTGKEKARQLTAKEIEKLLERPPDVPAEVIAADSEKRPVKKTREVAAYTRQLKRYAQALGADVKKNKLGIPRIVAYDKEKYNEQRRALRDKGGDIIRSSASRHRQFDYVTLHFTPDPNEEAASTLTVKLDKSASADNADAIRRIFEIYREQGKIPSKKLNGMRLDDILNNQSEFVDSEVPDDIRGEVDLEVTYGKDY